MANRRHLKILKKGVKDWNRWRQENPGERPGRCPVLPTTEVPE